MLPAGEGCLADALASAKASEVVSNVCKRGDARDSVGGGATATRLNSVMARLYCAPPYRRMPALLIAATAACAVALSADAKAPPRRCSSCSVSPKRAGGADVVPRKIRPTLLMKASTKARPRSYTHAAPTLHGVDSELRRRTGCRQRCWRSCQYEHNSTISSGCQDHRKDRLARLEAVALQVVELIGHAPQLLILNSHTRT